MDDLDSLLQDLQRPAHTEADSQTVNLAELDDLMNDLQDDSRKNPASSTPANELDDLLNDLSLGSAPAPAASSKPVAASQPVSSPAPQRDELDDLLNDLDAPAPKSSPPPSQNRSQPAQPPASVAVDDLDDLLDGLDEPAPRRKVSATNTGGGNDVDSLFGDINSAARSSGAANQTQNQNRVANNSNSTSGPSRGNCAGCNQAVHGEVLQASGKLWHMNCFCCGNCADLLGSASFFEFEGSPHCEKCYKGLFCPRCAKCDKSITDRVVTALGKKWHPDCFSCSTCNQAFPGGSFFERDGYPYCSEHFYNNSQQVCGSCNKPVTGECTNAMNKSWHPDCFVCQYCRKAFVDGSFFEQGGLPYCELHYHAQSGSMCGACNKAITGRSVNAMGKSWHPEHFVCGFCVAPIAGGNYTEKQGKPYCSECFENLFG